MKTKRLSRSLRWVAIGVVAAGLAVWATSGARVGWTQTSVVNMQRDEITGIDYPVRHPAFIAGVEVPLLATVIAAMLAGLSFLPLRVLRAKA